VSAGHGKPKFPVSREWQKNALQDILQDQQMENSRLRKFRIGSKRLFPSPHGIFQMRREDGKFSMGEFEEEIQVRIGFQDS